MGNQMSVPQRVEDQENESEVVTYQVSPDSKCDQNGVSVIASTHKVQHYDEVDLGISLPKDNVTTSSPKTMEISAVTEASGKNLGKEAKAEAPAAKSRFFLTLSRPVPGRPGDQGVDSSTAPASLDVSSSAAQGNKAPSERMALPVAAAPGPEADKTPAQTLAGDAAPSATCAPGPLPPEVAAAAPSRPTDSSFFDKLFKLDKGREKTPIGSQQEVSRAEHQGEAKEAGGLSGQPHGVPAGEDVVDSKETEGQEIKTSSCSVSGDPERLAITEENSQTTDTAEDSSSIMSFFKTLVSPNKAETKKDPEEMSAEKSPTTLPNPKSEKSNFTSAETQGAAKSPKGCSPPGQVPSAPAGETTKEGGKEKSVPTALPLGKLFWKKSVKEDSISTGAEENVVCESPVETVKFEAVESTLQTVDLDEEDAAPEPAEVKLKKEESKPRKRSLMALLRQMSVRGDGGITHSEEINGKDSSYQTSNSSEKATTLPEPEPAGAAQRGKEASSKDKKPAPEGNQQKNNKQEAKEPAPGSEQASGEVNSLHNGDKSLKRPEKRRQSLGGFLKGLGPKRMLDAQVQTDPVSIGPVGKSK